MSSLKSTAVPLLSELRAQYKAGEVSGGQATLLKLKRLLLLESTGEDELTIATVACQALELGILLTVRGGSGSSSDDNGADDGDGSGSGSGSGSGAGDLDAFARHVAQWQPYHMQLSAVGQATPTSSHIIGLTLMQLLVEHKLSEFHAALELLTPAELANPLVQFPIELERQLMVGLYDKVLATPVPDATFQWFVDSYLTQTVRDSIADGMEVSFEALPLEQAKTLMKFASSQELLDYIQDCRDDWMVQGDAIVFQPSSSSSSTTSPPMAATDIPSMQWMAQSLSYATEMERIV